MTDHLRPSRLIKARNAHVCVNCAYPIAGGEEYIEQTGYWDGEAFRNRFHEECFKALRADNHGGTFEFSPYSGDPPERLKPPPPTQPNDILSIVEFRAGVRGITAEAMTAAGYVLCGRKWRLKEQTK